MGIRGLAVFFGVVVAGALGGCPQQEAESETVLFTENETAQLEISSLDRGASDPPEKKAEPENRVIRVAFDWNQQSQETLCAGLQANNYVLALGAEFEPADIATNQQHLSDLHLEIESRFGEAVRVVDQEARSGVLTIELQDCKLLSDIRQLNRVQFVEPKNAAPINDEVIYESLMSRQASMAAMRVDVSEYSNPALYDPEVHLYGYEYYIASGGDFWSADIIARHNLERIYQEYGVFGDPDIGVAVMDVGVKPESIDFLSQGQGGLTSLAYHRFTPTSQVDGISPLPTDLYGLLQADFGLFEHGTRMIRNIYTLAPHSTLYSVRTTSFVVWITPTQFQGTISAILDLADNPAIRIISASLGTVVVSHEMARAIEYFHSKGKLYLSAAGTTLPIIKDIIRVVFPAFLPTTVSVTGLQQRDDGDFVLGERAHGGGGTDFVVDYSRASSEATSYLAGMIALIWSANPALSRDEVIRILITSSSYYQAQGRKHPIFGWGKIDAYQAYRAVLDTLIDQ